MKRPGGPRGGAEGSTEPPEPRHNDRVKFSWNQVALLRRFRFGNDWEEAMPDANYFRELAQRCCTLAKAAIVPEVMEQLRLWAVEFAHQADEVERRAAEGEGPEAPRLHVR